MSIFGWIAIALLVAYWIWLLTKPGPMFKAGVVSMIFPAIITLVLGGIAYSSYSADAAAVAPPMMGGRRRRW
jgi:hypothetical protein